MEPLKDAQAGEILVRNKQVSRRTLNAEVGYDFESEVPLIQAEDILFPAQPAPSANTFIDAGGGN
jgi:hypothetical protein